MNHSKFEKLHQELEQAFGEQWTQLADLKRAQRGDEGPYQNPQAQQEQARRKGFLPIKSIVPRKTNDKVEESRAWKEDTMDSIPSWTA